MLTITPIPAFNDNYIWCLADHQTGKALIVDPGQADPVRKHLAEHSLALDTILVTHHHPDHVGGVKSLAAETADCRIVGPAGSPFGGITHPVHPGGEVIWNGLTFQVLGVPGHTLDHIAFFTDTPVNDHPVLFCGDTLFVCGCGRLFEGSPAQMRESLASLRQLPDNTRVYCAHEYTLANLRFARHWLPDDIALTQFEAACQANRDQNKPTVPSVLGDEKRMNPFLRWDDPAVIAVAQTYCANNGLPAESANDVFAAIRHGKDHF
ncbi:hydroxyacylglutathione hydrolase [Marinobacter sp. M-5]|jgi:hydroxyacylglutathione hydrolase|uniref:hydroxyacylglutathione hydrolase n=1 Tax=Marinobacter sp. M-5 TaxID=3081089 RepID=UPI00293C43BD|nr:hydroxyacylglutathione hydrolase [Marinobacter sp. M-5]MDV3503609.1 hydroxyacylglutathione hydrolase [Marinobacter sp. M-5]